MKLVILWSAAASLLIMVISGCGGGGGSATGGSATKTATLVFSSYSTSSQIGGFALTVTLPKEVTVKTDSTGAPLSSVVYLSGQFSGSLPSAGVTYDTTSGTSNKLTIIDGSSSGYAGEFLTIRCDVPIGYTPDVNDISYSASFWSSDLNNVGVLPNAYAKATFN